MIEAPRCLQRHLYTPTRSSMSEKRIILVTGGSGLVGQAIKNVIETEDKREDEEFIFIGSKDANLLSADETKAVFDKYKPTHVIHLAALVKHLLIIHM